MWYLEHFYKYLGSELKDYMFEASLAVGIYYSASAIAVIVILKAAVWKLKFLV